MELTKLIEQLEKRIALLEQDINLYQEEGERFMAHKGRMNMLVELAIESITAQLTVVGFMANVSVDRVVEYIMTDISNTHSMALQDAAQKLGILPDDMVKADTE